MEYEEKQKFYLEIKNALSKKNEISIEELLKDSQLVEKGLKEFLKDNLIYSLEGTTIKKAKNI